MIVNIINGGTAPTAVTWNPSDKSSKITLSGSNLIATKNTDDAYASVRATRGRAATENAMFEVGLTAGGSSQFICIGLGKSSCPLTDYVGVDANGYSYYQETGERYNNGVAVAYGAFYTGGDVVGVHLNNGTLTFYKNGVSQGVAYTGLSGTFYPMVSVYRASTPAHVVTGAFMFAQLNYPLPSGASAWGG